MRVSTASALAAAAYAATATAEPVKACPNDICFQIAVPKDASSSGSGNLYFQMTAPSTYEWIGLGTGSTMSNSNMFVMYANGDNNITLSPRTASGHSMPQVAQNGAKLELLAGSGISNGHMVANVLCTNCDKWGSGSMPLNDASSSWISAWKSGSPINSASLSSTIQYHDGHNDFTVDLTKATVEQDSNPFLSQTGSSGGNGSGSGSGSGSGGGSTSGGVVFNNGGGISSTLLAHGVIMAIVFVILYPLGATLMPLVGKWMAHAAWQTIAFILMWVGFGTGYVYANDNGYLFGQTHTVLGTVVVCMLAIQPFAGYAHHLYYKKYQSRGIISHAHIWYGRVLIILGIVNGGVGLQWANPANGYIIAYTVVAAVLGVFWIGAGVLGEVRRARRTKYQESHTSGESTQRIPYRQKK